MKWAVLGSMGMLGSDVIEYLQSKRESVTGFHRGNLDLQSQQPLEDLNGFDVIVNCIAYTKVDLAEDEPEKAYLANVSIPAKLARDVRDVSARLIHISTDYVFDGTKGSPYLPEDARSPIGIYARSKAMGEELMLRETSNVQVVRTSWLYGKNGVNFAKTIAAKLKSGENVDVVSDQLGSPTHTLDLSEFIYRAAQKPLDTQVLHGVSSGSASWYEFAQAIAASSKGAGVVRSLSTTDYLTRAGRPQNSTLEPSTLNGWQIGPWEERWKAAADRVLEGLKI